MHAAHGRTCRSAHPDRLPWPLVRGCFAGIPSLHRHGTARTLPAPSGPLRPPRGDRRGRIRQAASPSALCTLLGTWEAFVGVASRAFHLRHFGGVRIVLDARVAVNCSPKCRGRWRRAWRDQSRCFCRCPTSCLPGHGRPGNFRPASAVAVSLPVPGRVRVQGSRVEEDWPRELTPERQDRIVVS